MRRGVGIAAAKNKSLAQVTGGKDWCIKMKPRHLFCLK